MASQFKKMNGYRYLAALTILAVLLLGCSGKKPVDSAKELVPFPVAYQPTGYQTILFPIAFEEGFYAEGGLDVQLISANTNSNMDTYSALFSGKTKVTTGGGSVTPIQLIERDESGVVIIGGIMSKGAAAVAKPENLSQFTEFTEKTLTGKKIGIRRTSTGDFVFRGYLRQQGVDLSKLQFIELGTFPDIIEGVAKGELDLGFVAQQNRIVAEKRGLAIAAHLDAIEPDYVCCRLTTTRKNLDENREHFIALLKGNIRAYRFFRNEPAKTLVYAVKYFQVDEETLNRELYEYGHTGFSPDPGKKLVLDFYDKMTRLGVTQGNGPLAENIDTSIYEEALNQVLKEYPNDPVFLELKRAFDENLRI
jgi:NitT/TauT family transport system substrate-binding protein